MKKRNWFGMLLTVVALFAISIASIPIGALAAVSNWQQSANIVPESTTHLGEDGYKQSVQNLKNTGANFVTIVIPYSQSNVYSTDVHPTWNTPTDESLISAIDYAHSIGLKVTLSFHVEVDTGDWRAFINPSDRTAWFNSYGNFVRKYSRIAQDHNVEQLVVGAELISMSNKNVNGTNTQNWNALIDSIRAIYNNGTLTYSANRGGDWFYDEKNNIEFWGKLDYLGISPYFQLYKDNNRPVESLKEQWDGIRWNEIEPFKNKYNKDVIFTEIGYRSVDNAAAAPYDYWSGGSANEKEQADDYEALLSYWNDVPYLKGVHFWHWKVDPNAGGQGNTEYTPQRKQAEQVMKNWFNGNTPPQDPPDQEDPEDNSTPPQTGQFTQTTTVTSETHAVNEQLGIGATIKNNNSTAATGLIIDVEIYNGLNQQVHQAVFENQSINGNQSKVFSTDWIPQDNGVYTVKLGIFNSTWGTNYFWENNAAQFTITVDGNGGGDDNNNEPPDDPEDNNNGEPQDGAIEVWWPTDGASVTGTQPFKAMLQNNDVNNYKMFWQVDGDRLNEMYNSNEDYPHKEAWVDVSSWNWKDSDVYNINFVAQDFSGNTLTTKAVNINVSN